MSHTMACCAMLCPIAFGSHEIADTPPETPCFSSSSLISATLAAAARLFSATSARQSSGISVVP
ncbi:hypothetical protein [Yoonia sp. I 8.24]|uniref:hypothetical protein n=1 Tax=Yoonia sp. I 8.24 TaxID=1537229 RepID=UPI001EDE033A|nr:hypothetical protein [Yoonia sp. I 8.24]MCG3268535.1 hypothetical protein [Yoonia sp. I 8.24]